MPIPTAQAEPKRDDVPLTQERYEKVVRVQNRRIRRAIKQAEEQMQITEAYDLLKVVGGALARHQGKTAKETLDVAEAHGLIAKARLALAPYLATVPYAMEKKEQP